MLISHLLAEWPVTSSSQLQLLGLFADADNASKHIPDFVHPRAMFKAAILLAHRYNITIGGQSIGWKSVQTGGDVVNALKDTCLQISTSNIVGIVGPALSRESHVIAPFAKSIGIPAISFSATDPDLSVRREYPAFFRTIPSDDSAAQAMVSLFVEYSWTSCVIIYQNDAFGFGGAKAIGDTFYKNGLIVNKVIVFDIATLTIKGDLKNILMSSPTRIVLLWAQSDYAELILQNALKKNVLGPQFIWILSSSISLERFGPSSNNQLVGLLTVQAVVGNIVDAPINKTLLDEAYELWQKYEPESFPGPENVHYYALFAFDATWALITALQNYCSTAVDPSSSCLSFTNSSFCFDRQVVNGASLYNMIQNSTFLGVSGWVKFGQNVTDRIDGIYYVARNVQLFRDNLSYVSVLVWSKSNYWLSYPSRESNVIVWPGNSLNGPSSYASISGVTLQIAVVSVVPFAMITDLSNNAQQMSDKITGYIPELIDLLRTQMGFISNITVLSENQSYNQLVGQVADGLFDIVVADLTITAARREKVAFSSAIFDNSLRIIIRDSSDADLNLFAYLKPFSGTLWLVLLITAIYSGLLFCLLERRQNRDLQNRSVPSLIALSMWYAIATMLGYGADFNVRTVLGRVLTVGLYIVCLISVAAYTANLASDLTISNTKYLINDIDDIRSGQIPSNRIGILVETAIEDFYLREISNGVRNFYPLETYSDIYPNLLNGKIDAAIMDAAVLEYATNNLYCNLTVIGSDFGRSSFGIAYQKKWQYAQQLDVAILSLRESGQLDDLTAKWFQTDRCAGSSKPVTAMSIKSMAGLFLTFAVISIFAVLLFLWTKKSVVRNYLVITIRSWQILTKERIFSVKRSR